MLTTTSSHDVAAQITLTLPSNITRTLLLLNQFLSEENKLIWVTMDEMHDRLVHCGVDWSLSVHLLSNAVRCANRRSTILTSTFMHKIKFFSQLNSLVDLARQRISVCRRMAHPTEYSIFCHRAQVSFACIATQM